MLSELLEAGDLGIDVGGVDVDVHPTGTVVETLDEDLGVLAGSRPSGIRGSARFGQRAAGGSRPEGDSSSWSAGAASMTILSILL